MEKIILIGNGNVGSSYSFALLAQGIGTDIGIIDIDEKKVKGDVNDLSHGLAYVGPKNIYSTTYEDCVDADLVVITAGAAQEPGETRLDLIKKNAKVIEIIVNKILKNGFDGIFLIASNPVDVLTYYVRKLSGFPSNKVIGSGTSLDSARLRNSIGEKFKIDPRDVHVYIMGEHGDTQFPVWSHGNIGGLSIEEWLSSHVEHTEQELVEIAEDVKNAAYEIINDKGSTHYGIAISLARITRAILRNENSVLPVSVHLSGEYGAKDVCISSNAVLNKTGVREIIEVPLDEKEQKKMELSVKELIKIQKILIEE